MTTRRVPTIRSRLILLVMACIVPASPMIVGLIARDYYQSRAALTEASMATARAVMSAVDRELAGMQAALLALATTPALVSDDLSSLHEQATKAQQSLNLSSVFLLDQTYLQRLNTLVPFGRPLPPRVDTRLQHVFKTGQPFTADLSPSPISGKPVIVVGVPVFRGDTVIYVLGASIEPERLFALLSQQHLPADWIGVIFDSSGTIIARTHRMWQFLGEKGAPAVIARMAEVREDSVETQSVEGIPILSVFTTSAISNWTVALGIRSSILTNELRNTLGWIIAGTALLLLISVAMTWAIGSKIAATISQLEGPALALGSGVAVTVPFLNLREADRVGRALTKASEMLMAAQHRASHDALTGLANRTLFDEILNHQLAICKRSKTSLAVVYIDLDGFKPINDAHGHATGDAMLCLVAARLRTAIRQSDLAARLGGDEFALILVNSGLASAQTVAQKLIDSLSAPYAIGSLTLTISASVGIAVYPEAGVTVEALSQFADNEMYKAKALAKPPAKRRPTLVR